MLYAKSSPIYEYSGHCGDEILKKNLNIYYSTMTEIQADGDELAKCCAILDINLPSCRVYTFFGLIAQEIAKKW